MDRYRAFLKIARIADRELLNSPLFLTEVAARCGMSLEEARGYLERAIRDKFAYRVATLRKDEFLLEGSVAGA